MVRVMSVRQASQVSSGMSLMSNIWREFLWWCGLIWVVNCLVSKVVMMAWWSVSKYWSGELMVRFRLWLVRLLSVQIKSMVVEEWPLVQVGWLAWL